MYALTLYDYNLGVVADILYYNAIDNAIEGVENAIIDYIENVLKRNSVKSFGFESWKDFIQYYIDKGELEKVFSLDEIQTED